MKASIVVGLGFGDEGKGITTDYLASQDEDSIVVRYSGGQQCGHTVVVGNKRHVFSNYGSGTLRGVPSFFSEYCTFYPTTIYRESLELESETPILFIHPLAKLTTPYDVAFNRMDKNNLSHGSCGLGIGATMKRHNESGFKIYAVDTKNKDVLMAKMQKLAGWYLRKVDRCFIPRFMEIVEDEMEDFMKGLECYYVQDYDVLKHYSNLVFEGSQGIMLDAEHGIFPNVTYSNTTSKNALAICKELGLRYPRVYYVTRCYLTRHGNGWMPSGESLKFDDPTNTSNEWQGAMRMQELDYDLLQHALDIDYAYSSGYERNLVMTCLDQRPDFEIDFDRLEFNSVITSNSPDSKDFKKILCPELRSSVQ